MLILLLFNAVEQVIKDVKCHSSHFIGVIWKLTQSNWVVFHNTYEMCCGLEAEWLFKNNIECHTLYNLSDIFEMPSKCVEHFTAKMPKSELRTSYVMTWILS